MIDRLVPRAALLVGLPVLLWLALELLGYEPSPLPLALISVLGVLTLTVLTRAIDIQERPWPSGGERSARDAEGADQRLLRYLRAIENHRDAREVDTTMLHALAVLARSRLERHDVALGDARSRQLLGDDLAEALSDPAPVRLSLSDIDRCLQRIEEL